MILNYIVEFVNDKVEWIRNVFFPMVEEYISNLLDELLQYRVTIDSLKTKADEILVSLKDYINEKISFLRDFDLVKDYIDDILNDIFTTIDDELNSAYDYLDEQIDSVVENIQSYVAMVIEQANIYLEQAHEFILSELEDVEHYLLEWICEQIKDKDDLDNIKRKKIPLNIILDKVN